MNAQKESEQNKNNTLEEDSRKNIMLTESIPKTIIKMSIPSIIAFIINQIYSLADTYFVSSLGTNATAAVSVNTSLDNIIMMAGSLLAIGANSYIARLLGAKNEKKASRVLSTSFFVAFFLGVLVMVGGLVFMTPMVRLLGATATCEIYSIDYARYVLLAAPFMTTSFVMNQCLRAEGSSVLSMIGMSVGGVLNCVLDPIFIFTFDLGVTGASVATAISKLVSFLILIFPYIIKYTRLRISLRYFRLSADIMREVVSVGSSSMLRSLLAVISGILLTNIAGDISDSALAGIGVANKVMMFPFCIILGFGTGFQPVIGFNWGAKRYDRVTKSFSFAAKVSVIGAVVMSIILCIFVEPIIGVFSETDISMLEIGTLCIYFQSIVLPIHAWVAIVNMYCAGLGDSFGALILSISRQGTCLLPILHLSAALGGVYGVCAVQSVADLLSLAFAIPLLHRISKQIRSAEKCENFRITEL